MKQYFLVFSLLCVTVSFPQSKPFKISGTLLSEDNKTPLESATVYLERVKDSSLVSYTISDKNGNFTLEDKISDKTINLYISYVGYKTYFQTIDLEQSEINLKTINLKIDTNALDEVLIKSRAPITIKKDTLEFNVKSFNTKKDANVEDLLKLLPGVEVDEDGKITVNGKDVNKILVNGKPFFGDDPTITTRNLTKDIIEKVQISDTKTKAQAFAGEEGDNDNKTINLTIKEENNKGVFGRVAAGGGTDDRYELAGMVNHFDNDQRISVLAGGNNTNSPGFSFGEIQKMFGRGSSMSMSSNGAFTIDGRSFGSGQGITTSRNGGVNFADNIGKKLEVSADYFYSGSNSENKSATQRENILPDSRFFTDSNSKSSNNSDSHSANLGFDVEIDSTFLININPSFSYTNNKTNFSRDEESRNDSNTITNESTTNSFVETIGRNFSNDIDVTKRFGNKGAYLKFNLSNQYNSTDTDDFLNSETNVFATVPEDIIRNQFTNGERTLKGISTNTSYRMPLIANEFFLDYKISYKRDRRENKKSTFDFDSNTQDFTEFNTALSTDFDFIDERSTPSLKLTYKNEKWSLSVESGYEFRTLENKDQLRPELSLKHDFENIELQSRFNYRFSPKSSMYSGYTLNNNAPDLSQLQPFQDVSDPLNTVTGNPNLEPSQHHRFYFGFNAFDFQKGTGFYSHLGANARNNQVVAKTTVDENFVRNTTYANVDGNYDMFASATYSKSIKIDTLKTIKYRVGVFTNFTRAINFNNDVKYASKNTAVTPNASVTFTWKDIMELTPTYRLTFNNTTYDLDLFKNQEFITHSLGIRTTTYVPKKFEWRNDINYSYNSNIADGFQKSAWFWNSTLAYSMLKNQGTLTLKVYDLLNQNTNARRISTANYIQDSQSTVLEQYFMLSFSWKFNSLGQKGKIDEGRMFFH
jgi:hypothetical protein